MLFKFVEVGGMLRKLLKIDGIWKYKRYRCQCGCKERIPFKEFHKYYGIPKYISGHQFRGKPKSKKHRKNLSKSHIGIPLSEEHKENIRKASLGEKNGFYGKHHTPEAIQKMSEIHSRENLSEETIKKMRDAKIGKFGEDNSNFIDGYNQQRQNAQRKGLEFYPLNEKTKKANTGHHINRKLVVFIPERLHRSVKHRTGKWNSKGNKNINKLAFKWIYEQGIELQRSLWSF